MTAPIRSMPELIAALKARAHELGIAYQTVDAIAGLPDRYTSKLFAPTPIKNLGPMSFEAILGALGVTVVLVEDAAQCEKVAARWVKRKRPLKTSASLICVKREEMPEISKQLEGFAQMQILGRAGGMASGKKRRAKAMKRRALQRVRAHAARMRWAKCSTAAASPA